MDLRVELVPAESTLPLRQRVLRPHQRVEDVVVPGEREPGAAHVAALTGDGAVVATAVLVREPFAGAPDRTDVWRLRGMATADSLRGQGVGGRVMRYALGQVALHGGGLVWASVRVPARRFYEREGFAGVGDVWTDPATGPHVTMWREVRVPED